MLTPCCASLRCSCQGSRPDESLDMDLALPLFQPHPAPEPQHLKNQGGLLPGRLGAATDISPVPRINTPTLLPGQSLHPPPLWPLSYLYTPNPLKHEEKGRIFFLHSCAAIFCALWIPTCTLGQSLQQSTTLLFPTPTQLQNRHITSSASRHDA